MDTWTFRKSPSRSNLSSSSAKPMVIPVPSYHRHHHHQKPRYATAIPSATAALLAATAIPQRRRRRAVDTYYAPPTPPYTTPFSDTISIADEEDGALEEEPSEQLVARTVLDVLLSPPEDDEDYESTPMERSNSDGQLSVRSSSTESVPSLDTDNESTCSFSSSWSQPAAPRRPDPRSRIVTSPPIECDSNHPLMFTPEEEPKPAPEAFLAEDMVKRVTRRLNLVSNLTASIRVLKSAAKSFTSLTASASAIHQPDDYLTRSILSISPQYTDERRPRPSEEAPTPALRRYLNPWSSSHEESPCTGAVQMQTYNLTNKRSRSARSGRTEPTDEESYACGPMVRQREVRENADFLRVIVLEMNMRRGGKLSDAAQGKARYMLPPRQACKLTAIGDPSRWEAWVCVYDA